MSKTPTKSKAKAKPAVKAVRPTSVSKLRTTLAAVDRSLAAAQAARNLLADELDRLTR